MLARKCDRCGKLYEQYEKHNVFDDKRGCNGVILGVSRFAGICTAMRSPMFPVQDEGYDLCPDCMEKIVAFLNGGNHDGGN